MSNRMSMPTPPGGELVCSAGQMPKIKIIGGQIFAECCSPPPGTNVARGDDYTIEFKRWALSRIKENSIYIQNRDTEIDYRDQNILDAGEYRFTLADGRIALVLFRLPRMDIDGGTTPAVSFG